MATQERKVFQSSRHRGMSSAPAGPSSHPRATVSILSSSRHVFGRNQQTRHDTIFARGFNPLVIEACLRPTTKGYRKPKILGASFNPLVIEACLRPFLKIYCYRWRIQSFNPLVIEACLRPSKATSWSQQADLDCFNPLVIEACLRPFWLDGNVDRFHAAFQSSRHRGMSSANTPSKSLHAAWRGFNPLVIEACLRPIASKPLEGK